MRSTCHPKRWTPRRALVFATALPAACSGGGTTSGPGDARGAPTDVARSDSMAPGPDDAASAPDDTTDDTGPDAIPEDGATLSLDAAFGDVANEHDAAAFDACDGPDCEPVSGGAVCPPAAPFGVELGETMPDLVLKTCDDGEISLHSLCEKEAVWLFGYADW